MNIQQLRQSLKLKWLSYYEQNRSWLAKIRVWGTYDQLRRPSSGFILATLSVLEPQFEEILPFILDLNNNPDEIITALGLNFNPDEELSLLKVEDSLVTNHAESELSQEKCSEGELLTPLTPVEIQHSEKIPVELPNTQQAVPTLIATTEVAHPPRPVPLVTVAVKSGVKAPQFAKSPSGLLRQNEPVRYLVTNSIPQERQGRTSDTRRLANTVLSPLGRLPSGTSLIITTEVSRNGKHVRPCGRLASGASLTITTDVPIKAKTLPSLALADDLPSNHKALSTLTLAKEVQNNGQHINMQRSEVPQKVNISTSTNARSLTSWVDEFCQGSKCDRESAILTRF
ncbi:hypothetical protein I8751_11255 [Nostocaceae cyanobacterium CENA357]|uniref:DUF5331 domain-containing protein n=1 Tax=Atlanticothrix silvestris CENA357 TaxID=1725252 RepID=A0A8J7KZK5_9CYAN|nr:DUF5331 domain-containing protein [Atlanticothrix silvestris]MBH8552935.1 hypothetical protein [Atlanticothrix silvestris CENA357]